MFVLDANVIIHAFKGKGGVAARLAATSPSRIGIPTVVLFEVECGVIDSTNAAMRRMQVNEMVAVCRVLPFDEHTAVVAAALRRDLEKAGCKIGPIDTLIAGTALAHGATLVTHNTDEFQRVPGLKIEDWFQDS